MLERQLARLQRSSALDDIVVATTVLATDDPVVGLCERLGVRSFRGSEDDVLFRYQGAAEVARADVIVRVTADCPLLDAEVVDRVIAKVHDDGIDYASNVAPRTFPRGLDVEAFTQRALARCAELATSRPAREHVTWFIHTERPDLFSRSNITSEVDGSDLRWTVDTAEDLAMVRAVYAGLRLAECHVPYADVLSWVRAHPEVARINARIAQKAD